MHITSNKHKESAVKHVLSNIKERSILARTFWESHEDTYFNQDVLCAVANIKPPTAESYRVRGGGPIYKKLSSGRCLYQKKAILAWLEQFPSGHSTAEVKNDYKEI